MRAIIQPGNKELCGIDIHGRPIYCGLLDVVDCLRPHDYWERVQPYNALIAKHLSNAIAEKHIERSSWLCKCGFHNWHEWRSMYLDGYWSKNGQFGLRKIIYSCSKCLAIKVSNPRDPVCGYPTGTC